MDVLIEDYIKPTGMRVREIVDSNRGVSADTALRLERYFGSEAKGWLALRFAYRREAKLKNHRQ